MRGDGGRGVPTEERGLSGGGGVFGRWRRGGGGDPPVATTVADLVHNL